LARIWLRLGIASVRDNFVSILIKEIDVIGAGLGRKSSELRVAKRDDQQLIGWSNHVNQHE
jgi:hypothetical protein